jgi:thiol-disulfide isomerase/thioredoxin
VAQSAWRGVGTMHPMARRPSLQAGVAAGLAVVAAGVWWWGHDSGTDNGPRVVIEGVGDTGAVETAPDITDRTFPADVSVLGTDGVAHSLASLTGAPMVVNVWASTCLPCRLEMPALQAFADEYAGQVAVVGIDPLDSASEMRGFAHEVGVTYPLYRDPEGVVQVEFGVADLPTTLFVRADGTVAAVHLGALSEEELKTLVASELGVG